MASSHAYDKYQEIVRFRFPKIHICRNYQALNKLQLQKYPAHAVHNDQNLTKKAHTLLSQKRRIQMVNYNSTQGKSQTSAEYIFR